MINQEYVNRKLPKNVERSKEAFDTVQYVDFGVCFLCSISCERLRRFSKDRIMNCDG